ncbi:hypothetical protein Tco_0451526 [Tanacetum coccineum]
MTDTLLANVQATQVIEDTHVIITVVTPEVQQQSSFFEDRVKSLEDDFSEFKQTNLFAEAVSSILDRLRDEVQAENEDFINKFDENINKIIKEQVKIQAKTSHDVAANLSELELKRFSNILATYGDTVTFKRRRDDEDEDDKPSAGSNWGSKRTKAGKESESTSAPKDKTSKSTGSSKEGSKSKTRESARDVYSRHKIIAITKLKIVESHNYKHLDWITVYRDDDKLYTFIEGTYNRLRLQDIEDMLLLLV